MGIFLDKLGMTLFLGSLIFFLAAAFMPKKKAGLFLATLAAVQLIASVGLVIVQIWNS